LAADPFSLNLFSAANGGAALKGSEFTGSANESAIENSQNAHVPGGAGKAALPDKASLNKTDGTLVGEAGSALGEAQPETAGSAADGAETASWGDDAPSPLEMRPAAENALQTVAQNQLQAQPVGQGLEAAAAAMGGEGLDRGTLPGNAPVPNSGASPLLAPIAGKVGQANATRNSAAAGLRFAHAASRGSSAAEGQQGLAAQDGSNSDVTRDPAGVRGGIDATAGTGGDSSRTPGSQDRTTPGEAFAALDGEASAGTPAWLHAGAHRAEAGFEDPALGWVGVRADLSGGGVHASVVPGSAAAAQALDGHLSGLNAYLAEQHSPVGSVTLAAPEGKWAESGADQGGNQSMQQGSGQDAGQGSSAGQQSGAQTAAPVFAAPASMDLPAQSGRVDMAVTAVNPGSGHISVIA